MQANIFMHYNIYSSHTSLTSQQMNALKNMLKPHFDHFSSDLHRRFRIWTQNKTVYRWVASLLFFFFALKSYIYRTKRRVWNSNTVCKKIKSQSTGMGCSTDSHMLRMQECPYQCTALYSRCGWVPYHARCLPRRHALCEPERRLPMHPKELVQPALQTGSHSAWAGLPGPFSWISKLFPPISPKICGAQLPKSDQHCAMYPGIYSCRGWHL